MTFKAGILQQRATIDSNTINAEDRTFEVVFATESKVFRRGWQENFHEVLRCDKKSIRSERLDGGKVPLVDNHSTWSVHSVLGRVISWKLEKNECRATIQFSSQEKNNGLWDDIKTGVVSNISVGYRVWKYQKEVEGKEGLPIYRAIDWEPMEISLVCVPADVMSGIRSEDENANEIQVITLNNRTDMDGKENQIQATQVQPEAQPATRNEGGEQKPQATQVQPEAQPATRNEGGEQKPQATQVQPEAQPATRSEGGETKPGDYGAELTRSAIGAGVSMDFLSDLLGRNLSLNAAKAAILDEQTRMANENDNNNKMRNTAKVTNEVDEKVQKREALIIGLMHRADNSSVNIQATEHAHAQEHRHNKIVDVARNVLVGLGERPSGLSDQEIISRAMATTDFPDILNSTVQRFLRKYYDAVVPEWKKFGVKENASDFRTKTGIKVDANVTYEEMPEGGEYRETKVVSNEKATLKLKTYARKFSITRQAMINDDLKVFSKLPKWGALGAQQFQSAKFWALITNNVKTPDNVNLFDAATHKNYVASGAAPDEAGLSAGRTSMRRQTSPEGNLMRIVPKYLLVPPELETSATKLITAIIANATGDVNVFANKLEVVVVDEFTNTKEWYLAADPNEITEDGLIYSYLEGQEGLFTDSYTDRDTDSLVQKFRLDFDCTAWGHRGWYKNNGE